MVLADRYPSSGAIAEALLRRSQERRPNAAYATFSHKGRRKEETTMDFQHSARSLELQDRVRQFMRTHVEPVEELYYEQVKPEATRYKTPAVLQDLKRLAREQGLWNLFLSGEHGPDLPNS